MKNKSRCKWQGLEGSEIYINYHDNHWGKACHDDKMLFQMLILEMFQAGLSWLTILKKWDDFSLAFDDFDAAKIALYDEEKIEQLMQNEKIIRNRRKITATINNAKVFMQVQKDYGSFDEFLWAYVDNKPICSNFENSSQVPPKTELSDKLCKDMKKLGFKFLGSTIVYSFMQSIGMVNDHTKDCFLYQGE